MNRRDWIMYILLVIATFSIFLVGFPSLVLLASPGIYLLPLPYYAGLLFVFWLACRAQMRKALLLGSALAFVLALKAPPAFWVTDFLFNMALYSGVALAFLWARRALRTSPVRTHTKQ